MSTFIEQQQELADGFFEKDYTGKKRVIHEDDLDTLITQIVTNTGEELMRRAEGELVMEHRGVSADCDYNDAVGTIMEHITNVTGVE